MRDRMHMRIAGLCIAALVLTGCTAVAGDGKLRMEKSLALDPGGSFVLDTDVGKVTLTGTSSSGARIKVYSNRDDLEDKFAIRFEESGGEVRVEVEKKGMLGGLFNTLKGLSLKFEVEVPRRTDVLIHTSGGAITVSGIEGETDLDTSGGSIRATDIVGFVRADTSGGSIAVEQITGPANLDTSGGGIRAVAVQGDVVADTSGGSIKMEGVNGDIDADTSGGSIGIREAGGRVHANTSGGGIHVTFGAGNAEGGALSTSGGGVTVEVDPTVGLEIDAGTSGGGVSTDLPVTVRGTVGKSHLQGTVNGGGATLKIRTSGGGIRIHAR